MNSLFLWTKYSFNSISDFHFGTEELKLCQPLVIIFHSVSNPDEAYSLSENLENIVVVIKTWINFDRVSVQMNTLNMFFFFIMATHDVCFQFLDPQNRFDQRILGSEDH